MTDDLTLPEAIIEGLPPLMGFSFEKHYDGAEFSVPYYTCLIGPFRIFAYCPSGMAGKGWIIERKVEVVSMTPQQQFFGGVSPDRYEFEHNDPLMLMAIIRDITSESNEDAAHPTGPNDDVLAPHE
jgi:hypothetical protein